MLTTVISNFLHRKFSAKILLRKFLNFFDSKKEIKKERQKACRMHIKNQKKKVINRLKKKVENSRFWRKKTQSLSYGNVEKANIFVAFGRRLEEIKGKRLELEKEEMYLFWAKYSKIRREKRSKRNEKVGKMVKKHGKQLEKECFYEWSRYQTEKIERARKEVFLKEKNNKEMRENVIKVLKENVRNKTAMKIRMEGAERSYIKYFLRIGFKTIHLNYQKSISKGLANTKAVTFACKMTMKKPLKAMKNYALAKNEKRHQIASLLSSHKAVLQKNFIKAILNHYMFTKITQKKQTNTLNKFLGFWSKFTQSHTQKSQKKLQLFSKISQKMQEIKKRNQFALWKEYHRKQFIKSLMNRKYTEFYNEKIVKKMYEALYFYYIKKNLSKRKMMKSEIFHSQSLKKFGLSYLFSHHELVSWKKAQIMKSLKFWCKKIKVFHFKIMKNNYKLKLIRRLRYKEVKELRKKDLQKDIVQKWFKVGIYWKEKEEVEYSSEQAKKDEKIWKLVQKIGSFWLSKIRRNVKPKISPPKPSQIPCKSPSKISQIDISYSAKPRPPPRRLH